MARASNEAVDLLHSLVAASTTEELRRAVDRARQPRTIEVTEGGLKVTKPNPAYAPLDTKLVAVAIKFLKDNGIDAPASSERLTGLEAELRDLDFDEPHLLAN